jgi:hypothetical protein
MALHGLEGLSKAEYALLLLAGTQAVRRRKDRC